MWTPSRMMMPPSPSHLHQKAKPHLWPPSSSTVNQSAPLWLFVTPIHLVHSLLLSSLAQCSAELSVPAASLVFSSPISLPSCYRRVTTKEQIWSSHPAELSTVAAHCQRTKPLWSAGHWILSSSACLSRLIVLLPNSSPLTPSDWTACHPTRQTQAFLPLFTLFQEHASSCLKPSDPADSSLPFKTQLRYLISAHGQLFWRPFSHPRLYAFHSFPQHQTINVPSELSQCDFHFITVQACWRNHAYFSSCTHD